jgi:hypothetical protein
LRAEVRFEAEPVDAGDADRISGGIENSVAARAPVAITGGKERGRGSHQ